jgi:putative flippase GtrA
MAHEFLKFAITGFLGTITNLVIFFILVDINELPSIPVSIFCFIIAGTQNYILNHTWSFKTKTQGEKPTLKKLMQFLAGSLLGLAINIIVMKTITTYIILPFVFIAQGCGILAGMIINFIISKFFIFKKGDKNES